MGLPYTPPAKRGQGKRQKRELTTRVTASLAANRAHQAALDARMAAEAAITAAVNEQHRLALVDAPIMPVQVSPHTEGEIQLPPLVLHVPKKPARKVVKRQPLVEDPWRQGAGTFTLMDAMHLLDDGYHVNQVVRRSGWGPAWFAEEIGEDGYIS